MPRGKQKKVKKEKDIKPEEIVVSPKESLEAQLKEFNELRTNMQRLGVDSLSKLDALAGRVIAELTKL